MSVSVSMPQLGESVTEGTVTRWLKREGERVEADEPLLEVSTDKVDTEIPSPVSGILRGITVAEDETVAVGAELAVIDDEGSGAGAADTSGGQAADARAADAPADEAAAPSAAQSAPLSTGPAYGQDGQSADDAASQDTAAFSSPGSQDQPAAATYAGQSSQAAPSAEQQQGYPQQGYQQPYQQQPYQQPSYQPPHRQPYQQQPSGYQPQSYQPPAQDAPAAPPQAYQAPAGAQPPSDEPSGYQPPSDEPSGYQPPSDEPSGYQPPGYQPADGSQGQAQAGSPEPGAQAVSPDGGQPGGDDSTSIAGPEGPYVTPLVRKLASEHGIDLASVTGTGVGGRIRKQDVLDAASARRGQAAGFGQQPGAPQQPAQQPAAQQQLAVQQAPAPQAAAPRFGAASGPAGPVIAAQQPAAAGADQPGSRSGIVPSRLRGTTEKMSRSRQVIAQRMVESLQTSAQLTTVVEADVTAIARLRERAKAAFEAREGVKLSFLPFFALAAVEALKEHPRLNAIVDAANAQVTYHDAEHLGIAVDTERGLMVPVIRKAGDLNIAGLARKIADLAARTRAGQVSPDELSGGTFTLTNTGSRGALFDTPIINQPQVAILGTGIVVKRPVVVDDPALGEVITVRSMVYLALTYDHRLVDGADAARFLATMKGRLEEGAFETGLGL
jgi:pyruvate dehydrogenase E2 component (dihydrolipoamide acetyltransferase)